jgi:hypothetical protein
MVSILKDIPIENIKIVPCRVNGARYHEVLGGVEFQFWPDYR